MSILKKTSVKFLFPLLALVLLIVLCNRQLGMVPALGKFLNPFSGVVQNENDVLENQVFDFGNRQFEILFDKERIPHVIASNENDMHFAQGFVTASDRLWQMDFMSYAAAGRLSEIFGDGYLVYDRLQRRMGVLSAAKETLKFIESNPETKNVLDNYTAGVNAHIQRLKEADLPMEYKLLNYSPEPWTNLKSVLVMKYVGTMLTGYEEDISASYMLAALGEEDFFKLYPDYKFQLDSGVLNIENLMHDFPFEAEIDYSFLYRSSRVSKSAFNPRLGSNAWAVSSAKSKSGNAILCNDPHLNLTLPSIWYEMQLKSNERNVYGYTIPGTPGVIIGFNENISWGVTNGATDVRDWYKLELKEDYSSYKVDGKWKQTNRTIEKIAIRDKKPFYDTVYYSEHGPIVISGGYDQSPEVRDYALSWTLHDPSNEFYALSLLNKANNHTSFEKAISHFKFPVQNFIYADVEGTIAKHHQGSIWKKTKLGQGKFISDGTKSERKPKEYILQTELPKAINPIEQFVHSANNNPWDSAANYYVNGYYAELRADKISSELSQNKSFTVKDMKALQLSNTNRLAEVALPVLLEQLDLNGPMIESLQKWNCDYSADDKLAPFFEAWWKLIEFHTWDEIYTFEQFLRYPDPLVLIQLMQEDPNNKFFDIKTTDHVETAKDVVQRAYREAMKDQKNRGTWGEEHLINVMHLTQIEALSKMGVANEGHPHALNATSSNWGPSMRMIVEMSDKPVGYGVFAGGPSGNSGSNYSTSFLNDWKKGRYHKMLLFQTKKDGIKHAVASWKTK